MAHGGFRQDAEAYKHQNFEAKIQFCERKLAKHASGSNRRLDAQALICAN
jgi:hypothetical protein